MSTMVSSNESGPHIVDWNGPSDPDNPFNWSKTKKWLITVICLLGTLTCNANATALTVAWRETNPFYGITDTVTLPNSYWPVTSWTLGGACFMLLLLPLIENYSVKWGYLISYGAFIILTVPQAFIRNFAAMIVLRFFAGGCVALVANCICGVCCDIWEGEEGRHIPIASYVTVYLLGTPLGPVVGAAILSKLSWQWIIHFQVIWHTALLTISFFIIQETRGAVILRQRAIKVHRATGHAVVTPNDNDDKKPMEILKTAVQRPLFLFCTEYVVFAFTFWSAFAVGQVFLFTQSVEQVFSQLYGWTSIQCGYVQAAIAVGMVLSWITNFYQKKLYFSSAVRNKETPGRPIPEAHLYVSIAACYIGILGGMFIYSWTAYPRVPWIAPAIGLAMVGFGINSVVIAIGAYVTACYSKYAISAVAAVAAGENLFAAFLPLASSAMYHKLGIHWPASILGLFALLLGAAPIVMIIWGDKIRAKSPFISQARYETKELTEQALNSSSQEMTVMA